MTTDARKWPTGRDAALGLFLLTLGAVCATEPAKPNRRGKPQPILPDILNIMHMWLFIEDAYALCDAAGRALIGDAYAPFQGFHPDTELYAMRVAQTLIEDVGQFARFRGRDPNAPGPTMPGYGRMFAAFEPIRAGLAGRAMTAPEIRAVLEARGHP